MVMQTLVSPTSRSSMMETSCGPLLKELQHIWTEIGESDEDKDRMLYDLEKECVGVYRRKVEAANHAKVCLHQSVAAKEAELAALMSSLGEPILHSKPDKRYTSLKKQLECLTVLLEDLRLKKEERVKQLADVKTQIDKINAEILGHFHLHSDGVEEHDLSLRKLDEHRTHLQTLQKEKSERIRKVLDHVNEVHFLCGLLGMDFVNTVSEIHPRLHETGTGKSTNISNDTLDGLTQAILKLKVEKKQRFLKLKDIGASLKELWKMMSSPEAEKRRFARVSNLLLLSEDEVTDVGILSTEVLQKVSAEVERLTKLKASRMKEFVLKRRSELEEVCRRAHIEPDMSTAPEKINALIDSGIVEPSELLASIEEQIDKAREVFLSRREILDRIDRWLAACEEENWLEDYNQPPLGPHGTIEDFMPQRDENRYNAGRGSHKNLKRAERARILITKIPGMVEVLMDKMIAWEDERNMPFLFDGVHLVSILEEYKRTRRQKEEEKQQLRYQKKLQDLLITEKESIYGSKPSPRRSNSFRKPNGIPSNGNGTMTPTPRRLSVGSATPDLVTPKSHSGQQNGYFKEMRRLSTTSLNFVAIPKEDVISFTSLCGSEPDSPPQD